MTGSIKQLKELPIWSEQYEYQGEEFCFFLKGTKFFFVTHNPPRNPTPLEWVDCHGQDEEIVSFEYVLEHSPPEVQKQLLYYINLLESGYPAPD